MYVHMACGFMELRSHFGSRQPLCTCFRFKRVCAAAGVSWPSPPARAAAIGRSRTPPRRRRPSPVRPAVRPLSTSDRALRAAAAGQRSAREARAAVAAGDAREARRAAEEASATAARAAAEARAVAGLAAVAAAQQLVREHRAASWRWPEVLLPAPPPSPEEAALRADLARAAQPHLGLRVWAFGGPEPARDAPPPAARSALGVFLHAGVAVTVTQVAAGRPGLPRPPRVPLRLLPQPSGGEVV
jgi:hypothetical protein